MLPGVRGGDGLVGVESVRGADVDGLHVGVVQGGVEIGVRAGVVLGCGAFGARGVHVHHGDDADRVELRNRVQVRLGDTTGSDYCDVEYVSHVALESNVV